MGDVYITGVAMSELGKLSADSHELSVQVCAGAMRDAGLVPSQIEGMAATPTGYMTNPRKFICQKMADYLGVSPTFMTEVDCGGNSSAVALRLAYDKISAGRIKSCLVFAAQREIPRSVINLNPAEHMHLIMGANTLYDSYQAAFGVIGVIPFYAMAVQRYMFKYGLKPEDIARVAVVLREHAALNPQAAYRKPLTVEDILSSRIVSPPIHQLESTVIQDGAAAMVLTSKDFVNEKSRAVHVAAVAEASDPTSFFPYHGEIGRFPNVERASKAAFAESGYKIEDVDVAEVYGAFAGLELMLYEELGFFPLGEAPSALKDGKTTHGGEVLINPSGGRLSLGHPTYVTPLLEAIEVVSHLREEAGERQRPGAKVGLVHTEHGMINGSMVMLLDRA